MPTNFANFTAVLSLLLSIPALAAAPSPCTKGETKIVYKSKSCHHGLVTIHHPGYCVDGHVFRIMGSQTDRSSGQSIFLAGGLCRALGINGTPADFEMNLLRRAERLAHFNSDGSFSGVFSVYPDPSYQLVDEVVSSVACEVQD